MNRIKLSIPGIPNAQKRHRHLRMGNFVRTYDPSATEKDDFLYKSIYQHRPEKPLVNPIILRITFYMPRPKSHYRTGKHAGELKDSAPFYHTSKSDIDNLIKFVMDSLNGVYYKDDKQIYGISAWKIYDENPRTDIVIRWEPS